jgi:glycosyltransferase involved in cell wall biosynthesis
MDILRGNMKFSIVTTTYNSERFLDETIQSVISQRGDFEIEYIIVDSDSSDGTKDIIEFYKKQINSKNYPIFCKKIQIKTIYEKDNGMYDGLAKGFQKVTGDIMAYINADDFYLPNAFVTVQKIFQYYKVNWITGVNTFYNEMGMIVNTDLPYCYDSSFIQKGVYGKKLPHIQQESTFWRKGLFDKSTIDIKKFSSFQFAGDFYIWSKFAKISNLTIVKVQLSGFRQRRGQKSEDIKVYENEMNSIIQGKLGYKDKLRIEFHKLQWKFPDWYKRRKNKSIITLGNIKWILEKENM